MKKHLREFACNDIYNSLNIMMGDINVLVLLIEIINRNTLSSICTFFANSVINKVSPMLLQNFNKQMLNNLEC